MLELTNHKKTAAVIAVLLCIPLVFVAVLSFQLAAGGLSFENITKATLKLQDGSMLTFTEEADLNLYVGMLERATPVAEPIRDTQAETPLLLTIEEEVYELYPSLSLSGCMAFDAKGSCYLLSTEDATLLVVRPELEYLYADYRLPTLAVRSGETVYDILPLDYVWSYKKPNGVYYNDLSAPTSNEILTCNLFANFENLLEFSVEPSHYSFVVRHYENGTDGYDVPVTSLGGLHFTGDTLVSVEISATWSQASNSAQYGEARYRFLVLYDVPAAVKLLQSENNAITVTAGGFLSLVAEYTNPAEALSISFEEVTEDDLKFYYHSENSSSYAFLPIPSDTPAGTYPLTVYSGEKEYSYSVTVEPPENEDIISVAVNDEDYQAYFAPDVLEELQNTLAQLWKNSAGTPYLRTDLLFIEATRGELAYDFGTTVIIGNENAGDSGLSYLKGKLYHGTTGHTVDASQQGVCVFAGELGILGNVAVIDHGCGIFSYYALLDTLLVEVGDQVSRGKSVGKLGASAEHGNFFYAMSVGSHFVTE